ncbi:exo-alpha-sialidase [soil metagenome]
MKIKQLFLFLIFIIPAIIINFSDHILLEKYEQPEFVPADDWFTLQRAFPFDEIPNEEYLKAQSFVKEKMGPDPETKAINWTLAGPMNIEGRITCIANDPANYQTVYIGTANGGLWRSTNFCQTWTSIFDHQNTSSIGAIAIDPANSNIIYCGTGESNSLRSYYPGTGIYKSTDAGTTWTFKGLDSSFTIGNIAISSANVIYAAAGGYTRRSNPQRGIYRSADGGNSWTKSFYLSDSVAAIDVAVDPANPNRVFAAMWERSRREDRIKYGGPNSGLYFSINSGISWTQVSGGFPVNDATLGRISIDIAKSNSQIIYALTAQTNGNTKGLYKTTNGGTSWVIINSSVAPSSNYAWFNRQVKISPFNANDLICAGLNMERSTDGGISFSTISGISHVDEHAIAFSSSNLNAIVLGNDGGIDYSTNNGNTWNASTTLPITQFYAGDIDYNNPNTILGGAQDNGTVKTTGNVSTWNSIYGGDGFICKVDPTNSLKVYASSQNGGFGRSIDGGSSFSDGTSGLDLTYSNWMTPYEFDKVNPSIIYAGTYKIFRSTNSMQSWTAISPDLANGHVQNLGTVTTLDVSKSNPSVIYAGTDDANVWVTTNGGTGWTKINSGLPYRWVTRVTVHPDSANVCYVTLSGYKVDSLGAHIYRTTNYGSSWVSIKGNLPDMPINDVIIDPDHTNTLVIGTDVGVLYTTNLGNTWSVVGSGLPSNVPVHDLTLHNPTKTLVAWTHGRSAFRFAFSTISDVNSQNEIVKDFDLFQNYPNPFNPTTNISYNLKKDGFIKLSLFDITGKLIRVLDDGIKQQGLHNIHFSGENLTSGVYFYRLEADNITDNKKMMLIK